MLNPTLLLTVAECDTAIAKANEKKVTYESRKFSLTRQIPNLEGAVDVDQMIIGLQSDIEGLNLLIAQSTNEDLVDDLTKRRNNFQNRLIDLQNRPETSVVSVKVDKHLDLEIAEAGIAAATAALSAYTTRRAELVAAA